MNHYIKKLVFSLSITCAMLMSATSLAQGQLYEGAFSYLASIDKRSLSGDELISMTKYLDSMGTVPLTNLSDFKTVHVYPGSMTPKEGLNFIPDDMQSIDIYLSLIEEGALPFASIFITNRILLDQTNEGK